jgi:hypothetical protein
MGAEFTATSMIGLIALGGIIVRQSILIVEFVKIEVSKGRNVTDAAMAGAEIRMRPILITSLTTIGGAWTLMFDPIFQGMAVSVFFGASVGTLLAVIVIPLGCITIRRRFYLVETETGEIELSQRYYETEVGAPPQLGLGGAPAPVPATAAVARGPKPTPAWLRALLWVWGLLVSGVFWLVGALVSLFGLIHGLLTRRRGARGAGSPDRSGPGEGPAGGSPPPAAAPTAPGAPPLSTALGSAQAQGAEPIRLPSFAADPASEAPSAKADRVEPAGRGPSADHQVQVSDAPPKRKRSTRKSRVTKKILVAVAPESVAAPVRKTATRTATATKAAAKKVSPSARPPRRPKGPNGKSRGITGAQPGPLDPESV